VTSHDKHAALESFRSGQPVGVDFAAIEKELAVLWKEASATPGSGSTPAVTRACHLNLVVLCAGAGESSRATATVAQLARVSPARVIMADVAVDEDGADADRLEALITAHCTLSSGSDAAGSAASGPGRGRQVCCEQITITAAGAASARLPGAVLSLLLPDLPVALWCPGDPDLASPVARRLVEASDRLVIDSRRFVDPARGFAQLAALERPVSDLAWHRLRPWRELAAGQFDVRLYEAYPERLDTIEVEHAGPPKNQTKALMLGCWAATRLHWRPDLVGKGFAFLRGDGKPARLLITPRKDREPAGRILSLALRAGPAEFVVRRTGPADCVELTAAVPEACPVSRTSRVVPRDEATLLSRCLNSGDADETYDEALHLAARLLAPGNLTNTEKKP